MTGVEKTRRKRLWPRTVAAAAILALVILAGWYFTSPRFHRYVERRVVADLEAVTGGRVEMKSLTWDLSRLHFEIRDLTIHGKEAPGQTPYVHVDRVLADARIVSLLGREIGLRSLELDRPVVHLIVYPDGSTNQPEPRVTQARAPLARLFDLAVGHIEVKDGELLLNDHPVPVDFNADDFNAGMSYDAPAQRYDGGFRVGRIDTKYRAFLPVVSQAEAEFSLWSTAVQFKTLRCWSGESVLEASGHVTDFRNPKTEIGYKAKLDLAQFGPVARLPQVRGGTLELNGQGTYAAAALASTGTLVIHNLEYRDPQVPVHQANLGAQYVVKNERLSIPHLFVNVFGGTVAGNAEIRNWAGLTTARSGAPQEGTAHLRIQNVPLQAVATAFSSRELPLDRLELAGTAFGMVEAHWKGSPNNVRAAITAEVVPPVNPAPNQLPVAARMKADYAGPGGVLQVADLHLATRATRLAASGTLGRASENLKLAVTTTDLAELQPVLDAFYGPRPIPAELRGQATFTGTVQGTLRSPSIAGHLQAANFDTLLAYAPSPEIHAVAAPRPTVQHRTHWDLLTADILYSPTLAAARNGILRSGKAQFTFDGSVGLRRGTVVPASPLSAHVILRNVDVGELQTLAGYNYPATGTLSADFAVGGTQADPRARGRIALANGSLYGEPISSLTADVLFADHEVQGTNLNLAHNGGRLTGALAYNLTTRGFRFDLRGSNLNLARIQRLQAPRLTVAGSLNFTARGSGTPAEPIINANLRVGNLVLNGEPMGDFLADAATTGPDMRLSGRSNFENADLRLDGTVRLRGDLPASLTVRFTRLDFDPLLRAFLKGRVTGHSSMAGTVEVQGPLRHLRDLNVKGEIGQLSANLENIIIQNDGPIRFAMDQQTLRLEQLRLLGEDTSVSGSGTAEVGGRQRLDLRADGHVNLKLLHSFYPDANASGTANIAMHVGGVLSDPQVQGRMEIANGGLTYVDVPNGLSEMNGVLVFNRDRVIVQSLTAHTGGGTLKLGGFLTYSRALAFNLTVSGRDIRLRYPAGISSMANVELTLTGSLQNSTLAGAVTVTKFGMTPQFDFAGYVARAKQPVEAPKSNSPLNNIHLDVHVVSTPELQVQTSLAKISGDVNLQLRGVAARPVVLGKVNIIEGDVFFNGTKYHLERGDVSFSNPVRIEPVLDVEATARVKEYDITLGFHGPLERLSTTYRSDPPLPTADIIALLALGRTREETAVQQPTQPSFTEAASYAILGQALNAAVSGRAQRIFGVSRIKIDPQAANETGTTYAGPQLSIEQAVNNNITLTYVTNLSQGSQQTIQLQYDITRNVSIIAIRDDLTGVVSFDVKIRQRRK